MYATKGGKRACCVIVLWRIKQSADVDGWQMHYSICRQIAQTAQDDFRKRLL